MAFITRRVTYWSTNSTSPAYSTASSVCPSISRGEPLQERTHVVADVAGIGDADLHQAGADEEPPVRQRRRNPHSPTPSRCGTPSAAGSRSGRRSPARSVLRRSPPAPAACRPSVRSPGYRRGARSPPSSQPFPPPHTATSCRPATAAHSQQRRAVCNDASPAARGTTVVRNTNMLITQRTAWQGLARPRRSRVEPRGDTPSILAECEASRGRRGAAPRWRDGAPGASAAVGAPHAAASAGRVSYAFSSTTVPAFRLASTWTVSSAGLSPARLDAHHVLVSRREVVHLDLAEEVGGAAAGGGAVAGDRDARAGGGRSSLSPKTTLTPTNALSHRCRFL